MFAIVVDSSCDLQELAPDMASKVAYVRVPLKLDVGDKEFVDDDTLEVGEFLKELYAYKGKTGSAAPSPQAWLSGFEQGDEVFAISISAQVSGSFASASLGKKLYLEQYPDRKIHLIDSKSTGSEMTLLVRKLEELIRQGLPYEEICRQIDVYSRTTGLFFVLKSMENLVKNGRVSRLQGGMAKLLGIQVLGTASPEGELKVLHKCRGKLTAYDKTVEEMLQRGYCGGKVVVSHCFNEEAAAYVQQKLQALFPACEISILPTRGLCSYYAELGGILVGFET